MKNTLYMIISFLLIGFVSCSDKSNRENYQLPVLDFRNEIPEKTFVLQDVGDVRYVRFHASDSVLLGDRMRLSVNRDHMFFYSSGDGDVIHFNKDGVLLSRFNRKGQGAEEYTDIRQFVYDTDRKEIFIFTTGRMGVSVYDSNGTYKRFLPCPDEVMIDGMASLDKQRLILVNMRNAKYIKDGEPVKLVASSPDPDEYPFVLLDKETGKHAPFSAIRSENRFQSFVLTMRDNKPFMYLARQLRLFPAGDQCLISEPASDTAYSVSADLSLTPVFAHLPSVKDNNGKISCSVMALTSQTMLIEAVPLKYEGGNDLQRKLYLYNVPGNDFSACKFVSHDFSGHDFLNPVVADNKLYYIIYPFTLLQAYGANKLSGELLEIAKTLDEEDNPILMEVSLK